MDIKGTLELIGLSASIGAIVATATHHIWTLTLAARLAEFETRLLEKLDDRYVYRGEYAEHVKAAAQRMARLERIEE